MHIDHPKKKLNTSVPFHHPFFFLLFLLLSHIHCMSLRPLGKWEHDGPYEVYCITHWAGVGVTQTVYCYNYRHDMGASWAQLRNITIVELADIWPSTGKKKGGLAQNWNLGFVTKNARRNGRIKMRPLVNCPVSSFSTVFVSQALSGESDRTMFPILGFDTEAANQIDDGQECMDSHKRRA